MTNEQLAALPWIAMTDEPRQHGFYWVKSDGGCGFEYTLLAHFSRDRKWSGVDLDARLFPLTDTYTHYTPIREPS